MDVNAPIELNLQSLKHVLMHHRFWFLITFAIAALLGSIVSPFFHTIHIENEHNPLFYLFYLDHLRYSEETLYTGLQSFVARSLREKRGKRCDWVPISRALQLERGKVRGKKLQRTQEELHDEVVAMLGSLHGRIVNIEARLHGLEKPDSVEAARSAGAPRLTDLQARPDPTSGQQPTDDSDLFV